MFYSQCGEDVYLASKYFNNYKNGFFIELGAMNGVEYSNTKYFEDSLNWTGILIEPTTQYEMLVKNRPNCKNYNYAISEVEGEVEFVGGGALGGIISSMCTHHLTGWGLHTQTPFKVNSIPIKKLLTDVKRVDLFSIDVEGGEISVLKTYDWNIPTYIILLEDNYNNKECSEILLGKGFELDGSVGGNQIWINKKALPV